MPRFNFTEITLRSRANIEDVMDNFNKIEQLGITESEVNTLVATLNTSINSVRTDLSKVVTTTANGLMTSADKVKLNGIAANANNYSLPTASSTLGGVKTTSNVSDVSTYTACPIVGGIPYYKDTNTTYSLATSSIDGLMSKTDKSKLDGIANNANNYSLPTASKDTLGGVTTSSTVSSNSGYTACPIIGGIPYYKDTNTTYSVATTSANGLMSSTMVTKLNGIATGATANTVRNNVTTSSYVAGEVLSAYQGYLLNNAINTKQKTISSGTEVPSGGVSGDIYIQYFN